MARTDAFNGGRGFTPADTTPAPAPTTRPADYNYNTETGDVTPNFTPSPTPSPTAAGYSPTAAYLSPGAYGLSQVGNAIGDTVSKYGTSAIKTVGDTFLGVDDFGRVPGKVRSGDWAGAAKSLGTGVAEAGFTAFGGSILRAGGKGLAFGAGKLGKYLPELETAAETGGRLITGVKQKAIGAALVGSQIFNPVAHTVGEVGPRAASSISRVIGEAPTAAKGAVEGLVRGVEGGASAVENTVEAGTKATGEFGAKAVNAAKAVFGDNADAPDQAPATTQNPYDQQKQDQVDSPAKGEPHSGKEDTAKEGTTKKDKKKKKPKYFDLDLDVGGQQAEMMVTR